MGLALLLLVFGGAGFLLTCQRQPQNSTSHSNPGQSDARQESPSHESRTEDHAGEPAQTETKTDEPTSDTTTPSDSKDTPSQAEQPSEQKDNAATTEKAASDEPRERPVPTVMHTSRGGEVSRGNANSPRVALTFDAGADARPTTKILEALARNGVHATFFLTGKWIEKNPEMARRIVAQGHEIGNHTYSHRRLTELNTGQITEEVERTEALALNTTGHGTKPYLRVPYGSRSRRVLNTLSDLGYRSIYWDLDCWDSVKKGITPAQIEDRVVGKIRNGSIVLMHCGSQATADTLDSLIRKLESAGYQPVMVSDLLGD